MMWRRLRMLKVALSHALVYCKVAIVASSTLNSCLWIKSSIVDTSSKTRITPASSITRCSMTCFKRQDCFNFCFNVDENACYIADPHSSQPSLPMEGLRCFEYPSYPERCSTRLGYETINHMCLKLMMTDKNYQDAQTACQQIYGHVLSYLHTEADRKTVELLFQKKGQVTRSFIKIDRYTSSLDIVYPDGSVLFSTSSLWASGQPSGDGQCACILQNYAQLWMCTCQARRWFVCQVDV